MRHTPEEERRRRLKLIANWVKADGKEGSSYRAIVGKAMLTWGPKRETVREYLVDLEWAGLISIDEKADVITWGGSG